MSWKQLLVEEEDTSESEATDSANEEEDEYEAAGETETLLEIKLELTITDRCGTPPPEAERGWERYSEALFETADLLAILIFLVIIGFSAFYAAAITFLAFRN